jgi:hypothetical protein
MESLGAIKALATAIRVALILIGILNCFFGYKLFKLMLAYAGFIAGFILVFAFSYNSSRDISSTILLSAISGIIGAFLALALHFVGVFLIGALFGYSSGYILGSMNNADTSALSLALALVGGCAAIMYEKFMIIISTSFSGSGMVIVGLLLSSSSRSGPRNPFHNFLESSYGVLTVWLFLGVCGFLVQYGLDFSMGRKGKVREDISDDHQPIDGIYEGTAEEYCGICRNSEFRPFRGYRCVLHDRKIGYYQLCRNYEPKNDSQEIPRA